MISASPQNWRNKTPKKQIIRESLLLFIPKNIGNDKKLIIRKSLLSFIPKNIANEKKTTNNQEKFIIIIDTWNTKLFEKTVKIW